MRITHYVVRNFHNKAPGAQKAPATLSGLGTPFNVAYRKRRIRSTASASRSTPVV